MSIKLESNIRKLLTQCEELINDNNYSWRLKKYIKSLDEMIKDLETLHKDINRNDLENYYQRCEKLKLTINYIESPTIPKRASRLLIKKEPENDYGDSLLHEINQMRVVHNNNALRKELLGTESNSDGIRKRMTSGPNAKADMGQAMKYYGDMQEKIAEEMLMMTRSLKEQTETANTIIKKDTEIVSSSAKLTDRNFSSLTNEAEKLQDHSKRAWKCWMWLMIAVVMVIFICMVLFMKVMKKKTTLR